MRTIGHRVDGRVIEPEPHVLHPASASFSFPTSI